jgi:uncharacterized protein YjiS (DUF1127 family)
MLTSFPAGIGWLAGPESGLVAASPARKETVMATCEITSAAPATTGERLQLLVEAAFSRLAGIARARRNRRSVAKLLEWDEYMLRDIGLTSGDVHAAMALRVSEDPSQKLDALSAERRAAIRAEARERLEMFGGSSTVKRKVRRQRHGLPKSLSYPVIDL